MRPPFARATSEPNALGRSATICSLEVAGYYGAQRTRLVRTGVVMAGATCLLGFAMTAAVMAIRVPGLVLSLFEQPFLLVIASIMLAVALGFGLVVGAVGAALGRWSPPTAWKAHFS